MLLLSTTVAVGTAHLARRRQLLKPTRVAAARLWWLRRSVYDLRLKNDGPRCECSPPHGGARNGGGGGKASKRRAESCSRC